jgi:ribose/xylose/arabinose/galactoside ABC-type transport system permease subunit
MNESGAAGDPGGIGGNDVKRKSLKIPPIWIAVLLLYVLACILSPNMFSWNQIKNLLKISAFLGTVALGQTFSILVGGIDLSVAGVITASNIICCMTMSYGYGSTVLGLLLPIGLGVVVGLIKGVIITRIKILPMIVTLALNNVIFGLALILTGGVSTGRVSPGFAAMGDGAFLNVLPWTFIIFMACAGILLFVQKKTRMGREIFAVGANSRSAYIAGINSDATIIKAHVICSVMAAVSGLLLSAYINLPSFDLGDPYATDSIAATVIGGTLMSGGVGGIGGTIGGAIFMTILNSLLNVLRMSMGPQYVIKGVIIVVGLVTTSATLRNAIKAWFAGVKKARA